MVLLLKHNLEWEASLEKWAESDLKKIEHQFWAALEIYVMIKN